MALNAVDVLQVDTAIIAGLLILLSIQSQGIGAQIDQLHAELLDLEIAQRIEEKSIKNIDERLHTILVEGNDLGYSDADVARMYEEIRTRSSKLDEISIKQEEVQSSLDSLITRSFSFESGLDYISHNGFNILMFTPFALSAIIVSRSAFKTKNGDPDDPKSLRLGGILMIIGFIAIIIGLALR